MKLYHVSAHDGDINHVRVEKTDLTPEEVITLMQSLFEAPETPKNVSVMATGVEVE
jgi:type II secretory pathway component PulC